MTYCWPNNAAALAHNIPSTNKILRALFTTFLRFCACAPPNNSGPADNNNSGRPYLASNPVGEVNGDAQRTNTPETGYQRLWL
jgi:hypothetical protein